jgi:hypothetical protein
MLLEEIVESKFIKSKEGTSWKYRYMWSLEGNNNSNDMLSYYNDAYIERIFGKFFLNMNDGVMIVKFT